MNQRKVLRKKKRQEGAIGPGLNVPDLWCPLNVCQLWSWKYKIDRTQEPARRAGPRSPVNLDPAIPAYTGICKSHYCRRRNSSTVPSLLRTARNFPFLNMKTFSSETVASGTCLPLLVGAAAAGLWKNVVCIFRRLGVGWPVLAGEEALVLGGEADDGDSTFTPSDFLLVWK